MHYNVYTHTHTHTTYFQYLWMFEQTFVKDGVETEGSHKEVQQVTADVSDDQQAQQLSDWFIFWPIRAIDIRGQEVVIGQIQHDIHGNGLKKIIVEIFWCCFPSS